ncbi:MAG: glycosyltransferase family 2 protein [Anaerolineaceae bacterium]|nr:glycosyltransferase family 2 protein [Anaerolineaceae bacterium]
MENLNKKNPLVYVVILNWNNATDTLECLRSFQASDYQPAVPIVVDNGSKDSSVREIRAAFPGIHQIELDSNLGYAEGNNVGIQYALDSGADYVLVLNNDTLVETNMLSEMVAFAETNENVGMIGPKMYCYQPENTIFATGSFVNWSRGETINRGMFQSGSKFERDQDPEQVDFIAGCGVLVSRRLLEEIGFIDPIYYLNYEDVDWGVRAQKHDFEVWYTPKAVLWHKVSATLGQASPTNTYYMTRNALLFFWKNSPPRYRWQAIMRIILRTLRSMGAWTFKPRYWNDSFKALRTANIMALRDFTFRNFGQMKR